jgi:hypothetical protein
MRARTPVAVAFAALALLVPPAAAQLNLPRPSPKASVSQTIGTVDVSITYGRPAVKGRVVWGELVPWNKVWRAGANEATTLTVSQDVLVEGQKLPAGTYSLHAIPGKSEWIVIVSRDAKQWGSYTYKPENDALRIKVKPGVGEMKEWLTWSVTPSGIDSGTIVLAWETVRVSFSIRTDDAAKAMTTIREALAKAKPEDWRTPYDAATFAFDNRLSMAEASAWIAQSVRTSPNFWNQRMQALIAGSQGKKAEALAAAEKAIAAVGTTPVKPPADVVADLEKSMADWKK